MRRWLRGSAAQPTSAPAVASEETAAAESHVAAGEWKAKLEQFQREEEGGLPDPRYSSEVEEDLKADRYFEREGTASEEEILESNELREQLYNSDMARFLLRSAELQAAELAREKLQNASPTRAEDAKLWSQLPLVPGPYRGPLIPRKALKTDEEVQGRFWDFFKQFQFGLWGYRQRPYPPERPIDVQQVLGFKWLDKRYSDSTDIGDIRARMLADRLEHCGVYHIRHNRLNLQRNRYLSIRGCQNLEPDQSKSFTMRAGGWYYKDRLGRTRGPMELVNLKTAWAAGIVDKNTFIWGDDMDEWAPIGMVYGLETAVATPDIKLATMGSALVHKISRGFSPWAPLKGHSMKSYKQIQAEAIEKREREKAVMRQNGGIWPGESAPAHSLFLWAGGSELTDILEQGEKQNMPHKFISYEARKELAKHIPGLRPWEVLEVEQVMDIVTYTKEWYREDLGEFTTRADYEQDWFESFQEKWDEITEDIETVFGRGEEADKAR